MPVYLGAPIKDVLRVAPSRDSFVNVRDFSTAESLGAYLTSIVKNETAMKQFQAWRTRPRTTWNPLFREAYEREEWTLRFCRLMCEGLAVKSPPSHSYGGEKCRYPSVFGKPTIRGPHRGVTDE